MNKEEIYFCIMTPLGWVKGGALSVRPQTLAKTEKAAKRLAGAVFHQSWNKLSGKGVKIAKVKIQLKEIL